MKVIRAEVSGFSGRFGGWVHADVALHTFVYNLRPPRVGSVFSRGNAVEARGGFVFAVPVVSGVVAVGAVHQQVEVADSVVTAVMIQMINYFIVT